MTLLISLFGLSVLLQAMTIEAATGSCKTAGKHNIRMTGDKGKLAITGDSGSPENMSCTWLITVPQGNLVKLKLSYYALKNSTLQIRDGQNSSSDVLETFRGDKKDGQTIFSSGRHLWVRFQSLQDKGAFFDAEFERVKQTSVGSCLGRKNKVIKLTNATGRIFSPLFPRDFPRGINCTWLITAPEGHFVKLHMKSLNLDDDCHHSSLSIRDGKHRGSNELLEKFCGTTKEPSVFSKGRYLWVQFNSTKGNYYGSGFDMDFKAEKKSPASYACTAEKRNIILRQLSGSLASYNYPFPSDEPIKCNWKFRISSEYKVTVYFDSFNLPDSKDCSEDYVEIRNKRSCGSQKPSTVTLDGSEKIVFKSSGKRRYPGFKASYKTKRTTATILKLVGFLIGGLFTVCLGTFLCYKCLKTDDEDEETTYTVETECHPTTNERETTIY